MEGGRTTQRPPPRAVGHEDPKVLDAGVVSAVAVAALQLGIILLDAATIVALIHAAGSMLPGLFASHHLIPRVGP